MSNILDVLKCAPDYIGSNGRSETEISQAETELKLQFANDYRAYLKEIGLACFDGHELTGLTETKRLDVVSVTKEQWAQSDSNSKSWYVVEETNFCGIVIWQSSEGTIYQTEPNSKVRKIANSLSEYIINQDNLC